MSPRLSNAILVVVTLAWFTSVMADIALKSYETPVGLYAAFMATVGTMFGKGILKHSGETKAGNGTDK